MIENVKNDISSCKKKALSNAWVLADLFLLFHKDLLMMLIELEYSN
jgi:hypothetical protein